MNLPTNWNELNQLSTEVGASSLLVEALADFVAVEAISVPTVDAVMEAVGAVNVLGGMITNTSGWPYLLYNKQELGSIWWESFSGIRLFWYATGRLPTVKDAGFHYFDAGKEVNYIPKPRTITWSVIEETEIIGIPIRSNISIYKAWKEILPLMNDTSLTITKTIRDNVTIITVDVNENMWTEITSFLGISANAYEGYASGNVTFSVNQEPPSVSFFEITGLKSVVKGGESTGKQRWIRPQGISGIVAVDVDDAEYEAWIDKNNPFTWSAVRNAVLASKSWEEVGWWLFSGCYLVWSGSPWFSGPWFERALSDDRLRQLSFTEGVFVDAPVTSKEITRRRWEEGILGKYYGINKRS